jgi:elongation factor 1-alpha
MKWYSGRTVLEAIDHVRTPLRPVDKPLRMSVTSIFKIGGVGTVPVGRVECGVLRPGMRVTFAPSGLSAEVASLQRHNAAVAKAVPGDVVGFNVKGLSAAELSRGMVVGDVKSADPPKQCVSFTVQLIIMNVPNQLMAGCTAVAHVHTAAVGCKLTRFMRLIDRRTAAPVELEPKALKTGDAAVVELVPLRPMCVEPFSEYPRLGRVVLRDGHRTVAVGIVLAVRRIDKDGNITVVGKADPTPPPTASSGTPPPSKPAGGAKPPSPHDSVCV